MTDPIRAALDKAAEAVRVSLLKDGSCLCGDTCPALPCKCARDATANAIAAFLRALPDDADLVLPSLGPIGRAFPVATLADAVLAAAKDQPSSDT
jgi:predicted protein tyrosine phosphatase